MAGLEDRRFGMQNPGTIQQTGRVKSALAMLIMMLALVPCIAPNLSAKTPSGTYVTNTVTASFSNSFGVLFNESSSVVNQVSEYSLFTVTVYTDAQVRTGAITLLPFSITSSNNYTDIFRVVPMANSAAMVVTRVYADMNGNGDIDPGDNLLTNTGPVAEGGTLNLILEVTVPPSTPAGTTNRTVIMVSSSFTDYMLTSRLAVTNIQVVFSYPNAVNAVTVSDGFRTISDLSGTGTLARGDALVSASFSNAPSSTNNVRLWYDTDMEPDGQTGPNPGDKSLVMAWNGECWQAVIPRSDTEIVNGVNVRFAIEIDGTLYKNGVNSWKYGILDRPDQGDGFNVFPTVLDLRKTTAVNIMYRVPVDSSVSVRIFDLKGDLVIKYEFGYQTAGEYGPVLWDGRNHAGQTAAIGLYFINIRAKDLDETRKVILVK